MQRSDRLYCRWDSDKGDGHARLQLKRYDITWVANLGPEDFVPIRIAALLLGVSIMAVYNWLEGKSPRLKAKKRGRIKVIRLDELHRFAKKNDYDIGKYDHDSDDVYYR